MEPRLRSYTQKIYSVCTECPKADEAEIVDGKQADGQGKPGKDEEERGEWKWWELEGGLGNWKEGCRKEEKRR